MTHDHGRHLGLVRGGAGSQASPDAAARQCRAGGLAGAARRASRALPGRAAAPLWRLATYRLACGLRHHASGRAVPAAAGARSASRDARPAGRDARPVRRSARRWRRRWSASSCRFSPSSASASIWKAAPRPEPAAISASSRRNRDARCRGRRAEPWQDRLFRLPAFLSEDVTPSLEDIAERLRADRFLHCSKSA